MSGAFSFKISSPKFQNGGTLPARYTCLGKGVSPPLRWTAPPAGTHSLTLDVVDPDVSSGIFVHWHATRIPPKAGSVREGQHFRHEGLNTSGKRGWAPPCPPAGRAHRYLFVLKALNARGQRIGEADMITHFGR